MSTEKYRTVKQEAFFVQGPISFQIGVAKNLEWRKYYVFIKRNYIYKDKHGICKVSKNVYLTLPAVAELVKHLEPAIHYAEYCAASDKSAPISSNVAYVSILCHDK